MIVKQLFKRAKNRKLILEDPLLGIRLQKPRRESKASPTLKQINAILAAAEPPLHFRLAVLAFTGMRVGELQRLRPEDIDLVGN